jgi:hypothetical protein
MQHGCNMVAESRRKPRISRLPPDIQSDVSVPWYRRSSDDWFFCARGVTWGFVSLSTSTATTPSFQVPQLDVKNFGRIAGGWRVDQHPRMMADVDYDGNAEIVGFGNAGTWVSN